MKQRVVICGGTGMVGQILSDRLTLAGYDVAVISRKPKANEFGWDDLPSVLEGSLAVVNLAGRPIACRFTEANKKEIRESRVTTTRQVGRAIAECQNGPKKWINASAVGIYGDRGDENLTESSSVGRGFMTDVCREWEATCLTSGAKVEKVILRIGVVLSSRGGALDPLIRVTKLFLGGHAGSGNQWISWIAVTDLAKLIHYAIEHKMPTLANACAPNPVRNRDFMEWLRHELHRPWSPPVPVPVLKLFGQVVGPDASLILNSCHVVSERLGDFEFDHPTLESLHLSDI